MQDHRFTIVAGPEQCVFSVQSVADWTDRCEFFRNVCLEKLG